MLLSILKTFCIGFIGGWIFYLFHLPLAWMLGSILAVFLANKWTKIELVWPPVFRNIGLMIIGYTIGHSFSKDTMLEIIFQLPSMLLFTITVILFSALLAFFTSKVTGVNFQSTLTGSVPGGLSQMVALGEETKGVDLTVVTILQVIRLISVIIVVPFLIFSPLLYGSAAETVAGGGASLQFNFDWRMIVYLFIAWISSLFVKKLHFPTPFMLGPIIGVGCFMVFEFSIPMLPDPLLIIAQLFLGIYFSFMMKFDHAKNISKFIGISIVTSISLLIFSIGLGFALMYWHDISFLTAFISMAPGGMAEMALVGQAINADLSIITAYHLFRILFILFVVPLCLKWLFKLPYFTKQERSL